MAQTCPPIAVERADRSYLAEYQPAPLARGWILRESYRDGWPIMAGPYPTVDEAIAYIDELLAAGQLCDHEDEYGYQSCSA